MRPALEVADIFRRHGLAFAQANDGHLGRVERRVMSAIKLCRTAALGGHVETCDNCSHRRIAYNSCRNRHCPKCQGATREQWLADCEADLLPVPYFHVVFTVPSEVAAIAFQNKRQVYAILFEIVAETLKTIAADRRHLGGELGFLAILHTWTQTLTHHPHIHCLVPGGVLADGARWIACRRHFFLPVHILSSLFRRLFLERLHAAHTAGRLRFFGSLEPLSQADAFGEALRRLRKKRWVVYAKPPFGSPEHVLAYLGRYTHRVAIANSRLISADDSSVTFRWRDYRRGNASRYMTLDAHEFIRRFLLHCLPDGFHRIRHYGFLANGIRRSRLAVIRQLLADRAPEQVKRQAARHIRSRIAFDPSVCPVLWWRPPDYRYAATRTTVVRHVMMARHCVRLSQPALCRFRPVRRRPAIASPLEAYSDAGKLPSGPSTGRSAPGLARILPGHCSDPRTRTGPRTASGSRRGAQNL